MVEAAIVITVFLTIIFGMLDASMMVARHNMLSHAARQISREAIVRGSLAPPRRAAWGPATYTGTAADQHEIAQTVRPALMSVDPSDVSILVSWPDGSNNELNRVQVTVSTPHRPLITALITERAVTLTARSTMLIAH
jgi:Flp pilus assembly protein TadG